MAIAMIFGSVFATVIYAADSATKNAVGVLDDGVYRIKNNAAGKYIDTYDFIYDTDGRAYLEAATGGDGQNFLVERQSDGTYVISALSEKEPMMLGVSESGMLQKETEDTRYFKFDVFALSNGLYTVSSAYGDGNLVLGVSNERSSYGHNLISLAEYDYSDSQMWEFVKLDPTSIALSNTSMRVSPYTIGSLSAAVYPSYITDKIEWTSSDESVIMVDSDGSYCALGDGTATVTASCGSLSASCTITVSSVVAYAWFSQHNIYSGGWNALALKNVYFYAGGQYKPYILDRYNSNLDWMDEGCLICCIAMLLRNMDARLEDTYDIRTGKKGDLEADPYTVSLANSASNGVLNTYGLLYGNPINVVSWRIADKFRVEGKGFDVTTSYYVTKKAIKEALDRHPEGVIVGMKKWGASHYLLFTSCVNPEEKDPNNYRFIVCDSASYDRENGAHVLFENSYSYVSLGYRFSSMVSIEEWNLVK